MKIVENLSQVLIHCPFTKGIQHKVVGKQALKAPLGQLVINHSLSKLAMETEWQIKNYVFDWNYVFLWENKGNFRG